MILKLQSYLLYLFYGSAKKIDSCYFLAILLMLQCFVSVVACLEDHMAYKNCVILMRWWHCSWVKTVKCEWFAYDPADTTNTVLSLAKPMTIYLLVPLYPGCLQKRLSVRVFVAILLCLQPIIALLRPEPTSPNRFIFRWIHGVIGHGSHLLAGWLCYVYLFLTTANCPHCTVMQSCSDRQWWDEDSKCKTRPRHWVPQPTQLKYCL